MLEDLTKNLNPIKNHVFTLPLHHPHRHKFRSPTFQKNFYNITTTPTPKITFYDFAVFLFGRPHPHRTPSFVFVSDPLPGPGCPSGFLTPIHVWQCLTLYPTPAHHLYCTARVYRPHSSPTPPTAPTPHTPGVNLPHPLFQYRSTFGRLAGRSIARIFPTTSPDTKPTPFTIS